MTDKPILFSGPMVRAILNGSKTQTRRILTPTAEAFKCPRILRGDQLWVRETWAVGNIYDSRAPRDINPGGKPGWCGIRYAATDSRIGIKDRPSIHMPRWASRLTLTVTDVRVQRVQDISYLDTCAEGVDCETCTAMGQSACYRKGCGASREAFRALWDSLNAKRGYGWDDNPWVAAYTFTAHHRNIDQMEAA